MPVATLPRPVRDALSCICPLHMRSTSSSGTTSNSVYSGHLTSKIRHECFAPSRLRDREASLFRRPCGDYFGVVRFSKGNRKIASRALLCCSSPQMTLTQPGCAVARSVINLRNLLEGVQYVRSEWRQIKVPPRAQAKYRSQEADARIASCREQEIEAKRCSSFREANRGTGMNSRARFRRTPARKQYGACRCHEILRDGRRSAARP